MAINITPFQPNEVFTREGFNNRVLQINNIDATDIPVTNQSIKSRGVNTVEESLYSLFQGTNIQNYYLSGGGGLKTLSVTIPVGNYLIFVGGKANTSGAVGFSVVDETNASIVSATGYGSSSNIEVSNFVNVVFTTGKTLYLMNSLSSASQSTVTSQRLVAIRMEV